MTPKDLVVVDGDLDGGTKAIDETASDDAVKARTAEGENFIVLAFLCV
jgi:hypothetical protein